MKERRRKKGKYFRPSIDVAWLKDEDILDVSEGRDDDGKDIDIGDDIDWE